MKVYGKCQDCKSEMSFRTNASTRVDFAMYEGDVKQIRCDNCGFDNLIMVDDIYAKKSNLASLVAGLVFLLGTPLVMHLFRDILFNTRGPYAVLVISSLFVVPSIIYFIILNEDRTRINSFNRHRVKIQK